MSRKYIDMDWQDSRIISRAPFVPHDFDALHKNHNILPDTTENLHKNALENFNALSDVNVQRIVYEVDGLKVTGAFIWPKDITPKSHPILIYNRGGSGEFGILTVWNMLLLAHYARDGYIIFASNYRGNDGGEGKEEFGGADIHDVLTLLDIARTHPAWDRKNTFMYGHSRGSMMTFLAIKHGAILNAAVAIAGPTKPDQENERPDMIRVYRRFIPQFDEIKDSALNDRSAIHWVDQLNVPLLLLHGDKDWRVDVSHTHALDAALAAAHKPHKTIIYEGGDHGLSGYRKEAMAEIKQWFLAHKI